MPTEGYRVSSLFQFKLELCLINSKYCKPLNQLFFRGHGNREYKIVPSLLRDSGLLDVEDRLFKDTVIENHNEFVNDRTALEKLAKMQHFGLPTRLMDITMDPLIALYFACCGNYDKDGEFLIFSIPYDEIKYYDSDKVAILSNLCKMPSYRKSNTNELTHVIQEEKTNFFDNDIEDSDLNTVLCVKAKQNNQRISQQQGYFFLFGLSLFTAKKKIYNDWLIKDYKIIINKNAKTNILKELDKKGINEYTIFPDKKYILDLKCNIDDLKDIKNTIFQNQSQLILYIDNLYSKLEEIIEISNKIEMKHLSSEDFENLTQTLYENIYEIESLTQLIINKVKNNIHIHDDIIIKIHKSCNSILNATDELKNQKYKLKYNIQKTIEKYKKMVDNV